MLHRWMVYVYAGILLIIAIIIVVTFHLIIIHHHHNIIIEVSITAIIFPRSPRVQVRTSFDPRLEGVVRGISSWNKQLSSLYGVWIDRCNVDFNWVWKWAFKYLVKYVNMCVAPGSMVVPLSPPSNAELSSNHMDGRTCFTICVECWRGFQNPQHLTCPPPYPCCTVFCYAVMLPLQLQ